MEYGESKVDALNGKVAVTLAGFSAVEGHVVECEMFKLLDGPWCEHDPRQDRVDK